VTEERDICLEFEETLAMMAGRTWWGRASTTTRVAADACCPSGWSMKDRTAATGTTVGTGRVIWKGPGRLLP